MTDKTVQTEDAKAPAAKPAPPKNEKFFFNVHIFDEPDEPEEEENLPPVFSEAEFIEAKTRAFNEGKQEGREEAAQEARDSLSTRVGATLAQIAQATATLFEQESARAALYERETIALTLKIFEKLFPLYNQEHGFTQLQDSITKTLQKQQGMRDITVHVTPEQQESVQAFLSELSQKGLSGQFTVLGNDCRIEWTDGGAGFDSSEMAQTIQEILQTILTETAPPDEEKPDTQEAAQAQETTEDPQTETAQVTDNTPEIAPENAEQLKSDETPDTIEEEPMEQNDE